ncbi:MAG: hypothetical protein K0R33_3308, partial [Mycobacterium sp.]|nr:hypothetical protein [Mycobacterium sp.]
VAQRQHKTLLDDLGDDPEKPNP